MITRMNTQVVFAFSSFSLYFCCAREASILNISKISKAAFLIGPKRKRSGQPQIESPPAAFIILRGSPPCAMRITRRLA